MSHVVGTADPGGVQRVVAVAGRPARFVDAIAAPGPGPASLVTTGHQNVHDEESLVIFEEA